MTLKLHGITNCDTVRKARRWLKDQQLPYEFIDFRKNDVSREQLVNWCEQLGWETVLNRRGMTWRKLPQETRESIDEERALQLMQEQPTLIRRPVLEHPAGVLIGFDESEWKGSLAS